MAGTGKKVAQPEVNVKLTGVSLALIVKVCVVVVPSTNPAVGPLIVAITVSFPSKMASSTGVSVNVAEVALAGIVNESFTSPDIV